MALKPDIKVPTSLYTTEGQLSREKVEEELKVPDPTFETAQAVFQEEEENADDNTDTE